MFEDTRTIAVNGTTHAYSTRPSSDSSGVSLEEGWG